MQLTKQLKHSITKMLLFVFLFGMVFMPAVAPVFAQGNVNVSSGENAFTGDEETPGVLLEDSYLDNTQDPNDTFNDEDFTAYDDTDFTTNDDIDTEIAVDNLAAAGAAEAAAKDGPKFGCSPSKFDENIISSCIAAGTYYLFFWPTYKIAGWVSIFLNYTIVQLIVGMGSLVKELGGITETWRVLRDIANVFLVFLTIYVGIATILGISGFGAKQLLWKIVLSALLVNFSITFTKAIIDVSNVATIAIYDQFLISANMGTLDCTSVATPKESLKKNDACINNGLAGAFWTQLKITTMFNFKGLMTKEVVADTNWKVALTMVMGGFLMVVLAFVFGAAGILLVGRFVILVFLIIVSPVGLVSWLTGIGGLGKQWWSTLLNQSFFAPLLFLMWWIAYKVLESYVKFFEEKTLSVGFADPISAGGDISSMGIVMMFVIIMAFLILGLIVAKKLGAAGAKTVINAGKVGSAATAGFLASRSLGWASDKAQRNYAERVANAQKSESKFAKVNPLRYIGGTKLDRGISALAGAGAGMKFAGTSSFAERKLSNQKASSERQKEITTTGKHADLKRATNTINSIDRRMGRVGLDPNNNDDYKAAQKTIKGASQGDIEHLRANVGKKADSLAMLDSYSKKQASALAARDDATPAQKASLAESAYKNERTAIRASGTPDPDANVNKQRNERIGNMTLTDIKENKKDLKENPQAAAHLSNAAWKQLQENKDEVFDADDIKAFEEARKKHFKELSAEDMATEMRKTKPADLVEHDLELFKDAKFVKNLDAHQLTEMQKHGLTKEKRDAMKATIETEFNAIPKSIEATPASTTVDKNGRPLTPAKEASNPTYTPEQQNIVRLHNFFSNSGRPSV